MADQLFSGTLPQPASPSGSAVEAMTPPHSIEAEVCLLGSMILNGSKIGEVLQIVEADSFYRPAHQLIYRSLVTLYDKRSGIDIVVLKEDLAHQNALERVGGHEYLMTLVESVPTAENAEFYANIVKEKAVLRNLMNVCGQLLREAAAAQTEPDELLDRAEHMIFDVVKRRTRTASVKIGDILRTAFNKISDIRDRRGAGRMWGIPTGFFDLDDMISGLQEAQFIVIAGRPSMGKTSLALNIAEHIGLEQRPVVVFSMEMNAESVVQNMLCSHARIPAASLRSGKISEEEFQKLLLAAGGFSEAPIYIDDTSTLSALELRARARRYQADFGVAAIIVDYLQLMEMKRFVESRQQEISMISRSLKALARELNIPVIALSQLSRAPETREDRRPRLADLRECVTGETIVMLSNGRRVPIRGLVGTQPEVLAVDSHGHIIDAKSDMVWSVGNRLVYRITLASGRSIRATASHRMYAPTGWVQVADLTVGDRLRSWVQTDLFWDCIVEIEAEGEEEVFDLTVPGPSSWLADGIVSHNSGAIEQDADVVILLYRPGYYTQDPNDRTCEAIVAKQRSGPTGTVKLVFQNEYMRFENYSPAAGAPPEY